MASDFLAIDAPPGDEPPAGTAVLAFISRGVRLPGVLHVPAGAGPHPVVVLLQGFPGCGRNLDLARALSGAGYAALVFGYRGSWGTEGTWSLTHTLDDAAQVTRALRDPPVARAHRLDPERLVLLGHCVGGFAALLTAAADPSVAAAVSVAAPDIGSAAATLRAGPLAGAADGAAGLLPTCRAATGEGRPLPVMGTPGASLLAEAQAAGDTWRLTTLGPRLAPRPVLLIGTSRDPATPPSAHHQPVVDAYLAAGSPRLEHHVFATDHTLTDHRAALARTVTDFLRRALQPPVTQPCAAASGVPRRRHRAEPGPAR